MPYKRRGLEVINKDTGKSMGKSKTVEKAKAHMRALYAATAGENSEEPIANNIPLWWLKGIFSANIPIDKQKQRLQKVVKLLKLQNTDGSMKHNAGSIGFKYGVKIDGIPKIIDAFVPERKNWPKRGHLLRAQNKSAEQNEQTPKKITQKDILAQVRKPMPPPQKTFDASNKKIYKRQKFKDFFKDNY